jgi:diguanylate cyclase (GGDEF)-like protein
VAEDGESAIEQIEFSPPDIVFLDVMMPGIDGFETCRRLKENRATQDIPVIFMTALSDTADKVAGFKAGAVDYVTKPIQHEEMLARVTTHLTLKRKSDLLAEMASLDSLTEIPNRRAFDTAVESGLRGAIRTGLPLSVIMIDVDMFKQYNDNYGHNAGDRCLHRIAQALKGFIRRSVDMVARYGGEEFAAVLPDTDHDDAMNVAEGLRASVEELKIPHDLSSASPHVTVSVGVATSIPQKEQAPLDLQEEADRQLYMAKSQGRNQVLGKRIER